MTNDGLLDLADLDELERAAASGVPFGEAAKRIAREKPKPASAPGRSAPTTQQEIAAPRRNVEAASATARGAGANRQEAESDDGLNGEDGEPVILQVEGATRAPSLAEMSREETPAGFRMPPPLPISKPDPPKPTRRARDEDRAERARTLAEVKRELAELRRDLAPGRRR